jgi:hypothetical protein
MTAAEEQAIVNGLVRQVITSLGARDPVTEDDLRAIDYLESFMIRAEKLQAALERAAGMPCSYFEAEDCVEMGFAVICASCEARSALAEIGE